jgi:enoyl-CoA hydratase/carnithine racemase
MKQGNGINNESLKKESTVTYHREGHIGFLTLNRPKKRNAMNEGLYEDLENAVCAAEASGSCSR